MLGGKWDRLFYRAFSHPTNTVKALGKTEKQRHPFSILLQKLLVSLTIDNKMDNQVIFNLEKVYCLVLDIKYWS